jgi:hypothetical protein
MSYIKSAIVAPVGYAYVHGQQVYTEFAAAISTVAAWSLIDTVTYTVGTGGPVTVEHKVWRCDHTLSGLPADFWVDFSYTYSTGTGVYDAGLSVSVFETYNAGTKAIGKYAPASGTGSYTLASDRTINVSPVIGGLLAAADPLVAVSYLMGGSYATCDYVISVTNRCIVMSTLQELGFTYAGAFVSLLGDASTSDTMPIALLRTEAGGNFPAGQFGATTRHPKVSTSTPITYACALSALITTFTYQSGVPGDPGAIDLFHGGPNLGRIPVLHANAGGATSATNGRIRGLLSNLAISQNVVAGAAWGDLFTVNGATHVLLGHNYFLDTTV